MSIYAFDPKNFPGEGYRSLVVGELRQKGDELLCSDTDGTFFLFSWYKDDSAVQNENCHPCRRSVLTYNSL